MTPRPPRWVAWGDTTTARGATTILALAAMISAIVLGWRQQTYIACVAEQQRADASRTAVIAKATDRERVAQRELVANVDPSNAAALRDAVLAAYEATDRIRAANPPAAPASC